MHTYAHKTLTAIIVAYRMNILIVQLIILKSIQEIYVDKLQSRCINHYYASTFHTWHAHRMTNNVGEYER